MKYRTIVADPPWDYGADGLRQPMNVGRESQHRDPMPYASMSLAEIAALPVREMAEDDSRCFLWTTNRFLPDSFDILEAWGFLYRQMLVWHKTRSSPIGHIGPNRAEFLLVGRRGRPGMKSRFPSSVITATPMTHSAKPEVFLDYIEAACYGPYLELFARRNRLGWDTWGNEALEHVVFVEPGV